MRTPLAIADFPIGEGYRFRTLLTRRMGHRIQKPETGLGGIYVQFANGEIKSIHEAVLVEMVTQ